MRPWAWAFCRVPGGCVFSCEVPLQTEAAVGSLQTRFFQSPSHPKRPRTHSERRTRSYFQSSQNQISGSLGSTDYFQAEMLGPCYRLVNFGAGKSPGLPISVD
jgi:hypothetical protein